MLTTIVLGTTAYSSDGTAFAGFAGAGGVKSWADANLSGLRLTLDDEAYSCVEFRAIGCGPALPFPPGIPVKVVISADDGSAPVVYFAGDLQDPQAQPSTLGLAWGYRATDLKQRADRVTLLARNGLGLASYNLSPTDPLYLFNLAGMTVGQILADVLQSPANAAALHGLGVGNYAESAPGVLAIPATLDSATLADLAALTIVPHSAVQLQGEGILNRLEQFLQSSGHSQYTLYVRPDGVIRIASIFGRPAHTLTQPSGSAAGDPVDDFSYNIDTADCYAAVQVLGVDIRGAVLSYADGTLVHEPLPTGTPPWTLADWNTPTNSNDDGTASSITSTTCTVHSAHAPVHWPVNYWNNNGGVIVLYYLAGTGIAITETRKVTACTALSAGGTATISWDSGDPVSGTGFTKYRLYSTNTPLNRYDRAFLVAEPTGSATGLSTYIGSHLFPEFPYGFAWGNFGKGGNNDQVQTIQYPAAKVLWSPTGAWPWFEEPVTVKLDPKNGAVVLDIPAVVLSADMANQKGALANGYPTTAFAGLWHDVQVAVPYVRGDLSARYPASGYAGTANSKYGITRVKTIALGTFTFQGDTPALVQLAQEHLITVQDAVVEGSIRVHYDAWTPTFDPLVLGYALNIATPGAASDIDGLDLPVRSVTMDWPSEGPDIHLLSLRFSNRHREFEGDDLYIHPQFAANGWGMLNQGDMLVAGGQGAFSNGMGSYASSLEGAEAIKESAMGGYDAALGSYGRAAQGGGATPGAKAGWHDTGGQGWSDPGSRGGANPGGWANPDFSGAGKGGWANPTFQSATPDQGGGAKGGDFGPGAMDDYRPGRAAQQSENETRRQRRVEGEEKSRQAARQRRADQARETKAAQNRRVPEPDVPGAVPPPEPRLSDLRGSRDDDTENGG